MKLRTIFPKQVRQELERLAHSIRLLEPDFNPEEERWHLNALVLAWCVQEILRLRKDRE